MRHFIGYNIIWNSKKREKNLCDSVPIEQVSCIWRILCAQCLMICNQKKKLTEMTDMKSKYYKLNASPSVKRINGEWNWFVVDHKNIIVNKNGFKSFLLMLMVEIFFFCCLKVNCIIKAIGHLIQKNWMIWFQSLVKILNLKRNLNKCSALCIA